MEGGRRAMAELLEAHPDVDGVFAANDLMALGAFQAIADARPVESPTTSRSSGSTTRRSPATVRPGLTTVRQPVVDMGGSWRRCCCAPIEDGRPLGPVLVPTELVARTSA